MVEEYKTIQKKTFSFFKEKGSRFYSIAIPVLSEEEITENLIDVKKEFKDARHYCYAYKLGADGNKYRYNDDGEPNNTAGKPIYGQLNSFDITNVLVIVVRYFGGTKLGVGGLIQAYKEGAKSVLECAKIITKDVVEIISIKFKYEDLNFIMGLIKTFNLNIVNQKFDLKCFIIIEIPLKIKNKVILKLKNNPNTLKIN